MKMWHLNHSTAVVWLPEAGSGRKGVRETWGRVNRPTAGIGGRLA
jgi:hypothetical protein